MSSFEVYNNILLKTDLRDPDVVFGTGTVIQKNNKGISIGLGSGQYGQGSNSIAIGVCAGQYTQGSNSIAIGSGGNFGKIIFTESPGQYNQGSNSENEQ